MNKKEFIKEYGRQLVIMLLVGLLTAGIIFTFEFLGSTDKDLPKNFPDVYQKATTQNKEVVELANSVNKKIEQINKMDLEGNSEQSLELIEEAREENQKAKNKAEDLSDTLEGLNAMLDKSGEAEKLEVAREALAIEEKLVEEFLNYTNSLSNFLTAVEDAINSNSFNDRISVDRKLDQVNKHKNKINSLNQKLVSKIQEFRGSTTN